MTAEPPDETDVFSATALIEFLRAIGIGSDAMAALEVDALTFGGLVPEVPVAGFRTLTAPACRAVVAAYGPSITIDVVTDTDIRLTISSAMTDQRLSEFVASIDPNTTTFDVNISLDKPALVARALGSMSVPGDVSVVGFMFAARAKATFEQSPAKLEQDLWSNGKKRVVVLVGDAAVDLRGTWLSVHGPASQRSLDELLARPAPDPLINAGVIKARDDVIAWDEPFATTLTPWHFALDGEPCPIGAAIATKLVTLAAIYTCDRARRQTVSGATWIRAEYRSKDDSATLDVPLRGTLTDLDPQSSLALIDLVEWCYGDDSTTTRAIVAADRLPLLQAQVVKLLGATTPTERLRRLIAGTPGLLNALGWQWKVFITDKVGDYLDQVDKVGTAATTAVTAYSTSVGELTKGLQDAVVAAVAAVLGSMIAAAFATPFNAALFRVGMFTYAGYVLFFPCLVGIIATSNRVALATKTWEHERSQFEETIKPTVLDDIVGTQITDATTSFERWRLAVGVIYALLVIGAIVAAAAIPNLV